MTTDLACLALLTLWGFVLVYSVSFGKLRTAGVKYGLGNREQPVPDLPEWTKRAERAVANHMENLPAFAIAVLIVHVTGRADELSAIGAMIALGSRILHGVVYIAGITVVRTLAYYGGLAGTLLVFSRLL